MRGVEIREIAPSSIDDINKMCVMPGSGHEAALAVLPQNAVLVEAVFGLQCPWVIQQYRGCLSIAGSISDKVITREYLIHAHSDALLLGEENLYIDGVAPFSGPIRREELEHAIRHALASAP